MKINHPLMHNNFLKSDMDAVRKLIKTKNLILTQSQKVSEFEQKWSKWLGVKYSVCKLRVFSKLFIYVDFKEHVPEKKKL